MKASRWDFSACDIGSSTIRCRAQFSTFNLYTRLESSKTFHAGKPTGGWGSPSGLSRPDKLRDHCRSSRRGLYLLHEFNVLRARNRHHSASIFQRFVQSKILLKKAEKCLSASYRPFSRSFLRAAISCELIVPSITLCRRPATVAVERAGEFELFLAKSNNPKASSRSCSETCGMRSRSCDKKRRRAIVTTCPPSNSPTASRGVCLLEAIKRSICRLRSFCDGPYFWAEKYLDIRNQALQRRFALKGSSRPLYGSTEASVGFGLKGVLTPQLLRSSTLCLRVRKTSFSL